MNTHTQLALLRGINVSGQKIIRMEDLRNLLEMEGFINVRTFIQSGNIIFDSKDSKATNSQHIHQAIFDEYGFDVAVIVIDITDLELIISGNPFKNEKDIDFRRLYVVYLSEIPLSDYLSTIDEHQFEPDEFVIADRAIYIKYADSASNSKLTNALIEKRLKVVATTRNWNTTMKLFDLLNT